MHPLDVALNHCKAGHPDVAERILREHPEDLRAQFNLGWHELRHGNFRKGFEGMDRGRWLGVFGSPAIPGPIWKDQPLVGSTVLLRSEGGLGDEILNFRFARSLRWRGAHPIVSCSRTLAPLFAAQGVACVTDPTAAYYDYWIPAMSAAYVLGFDNESLPNQPYIHRHPRIASGTLRVGLRWGGNIGQADIEPARKLPVRELLRAVAGLPIDLVSFQRDADLISDFPGETPQLHTWRDTQHELSQVDLLITSCTSVAHLAGAMGIPTWILTPIMPYYTWALPGDTTPWYPSVRLFRQVTPNDWAVPLAQVSEALRQWHTAASS
jgi:hypothetical protein